MVDLDLDVIRLRDGTVLLDDEDEFAEHRVLYGYPEDVVERALATSRDLLESVRERRPPFGPIPEKWLDVLAAHTS